MAGRDFRDKIFTTRAVSEAVARERGYAFYEADDQDTVLGVDPRLNKNPTWFQQAIASSGWAIPKFAVMPDDPDFGWPPYAQLRPDWPVMPTWRGHKHSGMLHKSEAEMQKRRGEGKGRCYCGQIHKSPPIRRAPNWDAPLPRGTNFGEAYEAMLALRAEVEHDWYQPPIPDRLIHEASTCDFVALPTEEMERRCGVWRDGELIRDEKGKVLVRTGHRHPHTGEIVVPLDKPHSHLDWAKYVYVKGRGRAQRIGTHPRVLKSGFAAPEGLFFFVIEGTLKLDAVVTAGWPGIEAGSVTLWNARILDEMNEPPDWEPGRPYARVANELENFARRHLAGVPTAVVCDSDWAENWMVREQVDAAVRILAACGVPAVGCAPPPGDRLAWDDPVTAYPKHAKNGVDDWLARPKNRRRRHEAMLDLIVREDGDEDAPGLEAMVARVASNSKGRENVRRLLRELGRRATDSGIVAYREAAIARSLRPGLSTTSVQRWRRLLEDAGALTEVAGVSYRLDDGAMHAVPPRLLLRADLRPAPHNRTLGEWLAKRS